MPFENNLFEKRLSLSRTKKKLLKYIHTIKKVLSTKSRAAFVCASILGIGTLWPFYFTGETTWNNFEIHSLFFFFSAAIWQKVISDGWIIFIERERQG